VPEVEAVFQATVVEEEVEEPISSESTGD